MHSSYILSLIILGLGFIIYYMFFKKRKNVKANLFIAIATCVIIVAVLVYPLLEYNNVFIKCFAAFIYGIRCMGMGQDLNFLSKVDLATVKGEIYFASMFILFIILPLLTATFVLTFLERIISRFRLFASKNKKLCVFSEINEKTLLLAQELSKNKNNKIILIKTNTKPNIPFNSIKINKKITEVKFDSKSDITFYMISQDEEKNLTEALELISMYKNREKTKIYVINENEETPVILDSTDKGKITVEIINEKERAVFNLLNNKPLFLNTIDNTISILIVGCGNLGKEFLRDSLWCSMMVGYSLEMLIIDKDADRIKESIKTDYPELLDNYNIEFLNAYIKSSEVLEKLKERRNINYILVSMDNDDKNIDTAIMLRRFFIRNFNRKPIINMWIENELKQEEILKLTNEKGNEYEFNAFGCIKDLYYENNIINSELEKLAIQVNLAYDPDDKDLHNYNLREYNKRSSRANALHIKYKMYSILKDKFTDDMRINQELFKELYTPEVEEALIRKEHDRWMAYTRSIGYVYVSTKDVKKYYDTNKHYIHYLARMHPALVDFEELDEVSKELSKIIGKDAKMKEKDKFLVRSIVEKFKF